MTKTAETYRVSVETVRDETPTVKTFRFRFSEGTDFTFLPGQWAMAYFPEDLKNGSAYSMASSPLERGYVEFSLCGVGDFSKRLFRLRAGDSLLLKGPYGKWVYTDDIAHAVLISEGTGITPFRSVARYVVQKKLPNRLTIFSFSKTPKEILYRREMDEHSKLSNIKIHHTTAEPDLGKIKAAVRDFSEAHYFLCGPNHLVRTLSLNLSAHGIPKEQIHHEQWGDF